MTVAGAVLEDQMKYEEGGGIVNNTTAELMAVVC